MVRIKMLRDGGRRLAPVARFLAPEAVRSDRDRAERRPDRAQYGTAAWQRLRWSVLVRDDFTCRFCGWEHPLSRECRELKAIGRGDLVQGKAPELVADHKIAHRGDTALFWDEDNLQCLCKRCHDADKQRTERSGSRVASSPLTEG